MGNVVGNSGLLSDGGCNRFCVVVQACDAADDPIHILGDLLIDHLDGFDFFSNRLGKRCCAIGQIFDLARDNGKTFTCLACARGFDRCVQGQQIDLVRNRINKFDGFSIVSDDATKSPMTFVVELADFFKARLFDCDTCNDRDISLIEAFISSTAAAVDAAMSADYILTARSAVMSVAYFVTPMTLPLRS